MTKNEENGALAEFDPMLKNAIDSIEMGYADFVKSSEEPRRAVAAIRNFYAGCLLLLKEKLRRMSPPDSDDVLIKESFNFVDRDGQLTIKGVGVKTIDFRGIQDRFRSLALPFDFKHMEKLNKIRNNAEHRVPGKASELREAIANVVFIVRDFMKSQLDVDPLDVFDLDAWERMVDETELWKAIVNSRTRLTRVPRACQPISFFLCLECLSENVKADGDDYFSAKFFCQTCGTRMDALALAPSVRRTISDNEPGMFEVCDTCDDSFVFRDICFGCGDGWPVCESEGCEEFLEEQDSDGACAKCAAKGIAATEPERNPYEDFDSTWRA